MSALRWIALAAGVIIFAITLYFVDLAEAAVMVRRLGLVLPIALFFSGLWHLARTWAWHWCFPEPRTVRFATLTRVRLAAEAFSYLTLRGIAGEPLKVVLLDGLVDTRRATAAVALDRLAFLVGTTLIVGVGSVMAMAMLPLTHGWFRVFRAFAIVGAVTGVLTAMAISGRGTYFETLVGRIDRRFGSRIANGRIARFICAVERMMLDLVRHHPKRLAVLAVSTIVSYVCMVLEAWVVLRAASGNVSLTGAFAVETFSRVASFASSVIPANLGTLEASSVAAAAAIGASGGAALAVARRLRGLFWAGLGLAVYPRRPASTTPSDFRPSRGESASRTLLYLPHAGDVTIPPSTRLAGIAIAERVVRAARRAGYSRVIVLSPGSCTGDTFEAPVTVVGAGTVVSPALLEAAMAFAPAADQVCDVPAGPDWQESGVLRAGREAAADCARLASELAARRRRALPLPSGEDVSNGRARLALRITTGQELAAAEDVIRRSSYWIGGLAVAGTLTTFGLLIFLRHRITSGRPERLHAIARDRFQSEPSWWTRLFLRSSSIATRAAMPYGILVLAIRVNPRFVTIRTIRVNPRFVTI
jgi:hypothetical protein